MNANIPSISLIYPNHAIVSENWLRSRYADDEATHFLKREQIHLFHEPAEDQRVDAVWNEAYREDFDFICSELQDRGIVTFAIRH